MNRYSILTFIGMSLWIIETAFFGWNLTAESGMERLLDTISWLMILWGIIGDISSNLQIVKNINIKTDKLYMKDGALKEVDHE